MKPSNGSGRSRNASVGRVRTGLLAIVVLAIVLVAGAMVIRSTGSASSKGSPDGDAAPMGPLRCSSSAFVVGDSRRTAEYALVPHTTDRIWAEELGTEGGEPIAEMRHVRYFAAPKAIHEQFETDLATAMDTCTPGERPLVFDFMGTNYGGRSPERVSDPAFYDEIGQTIGRFYDAAAPGARVVLVELTLNRANPDPTARAGIENYLDRYNRMLRELARSKPSRYLYLPAPPIYRDDVVWDDPIHESKGALVTQLESGGDPGALDAAGVAAMTRTGTVCGLLTDPRFGPAENSEVATLVATLQSFRRSGAAARWLDSEAPVAGSALRAVRTPTCSF